jgi:WD40 repeat protein
MSSLADRYLGTQPFSDSALDRLRFRGRNTESELLLHQLIGADLLVLFGKPGLGKTSLLNARLLPLLRARDFLPLPVRFNQLDSLRPMEVFTGAIEQTCKANKIDYTPGDPNSLWEFFKTSVFWRGDRLQTPVLILDQFEEIFTLQTDEFRREVAAELGELLSHRLPDRLWQKLQSGQPLNFSEKAPEIKVLLSLREDDLGMLQELTPQLPSILQNRFRIIPLSREDAQLAIVEPAALVSEEIQFRAAPFTYEAGTVDEILTAARQPRGGIDPFLLQLICQHVERKVLDQQSRHHSSPRTTVDSTYLGGEEGLRALAANFYLDTIKALPRVNLQRRVRSLCEEGLLTENGRRRAILKDEVANRFKLEQESLQSLERARLLRSESREGSIYYEISHDRIAEAIHQNRRWRMPPKLKSMIGVFTFAFSLFSVMLAVWALEERWVAMRKDQEIQRLLEEVATSDRFVAQAKLMLGEESEALAYLARACRCAPRSSIPAEVAVPTILSIAQSHVEFKGHGDQVLSAVFSPDGRRVLTASRDNTARLWDANNGKLVATFEGHRDAVLSAVFSPDGRRVLTASSDGTARVWEADNAKLLTTLQGPSGPVTSAVFSPDGRRVLTASSDGTARLWEVDNAKLLTTLQGPSGPVTSAVFSPDGRHVLTALSDGTAQLWEADSAKLLATLQGHNGPVTSAVFSRDGRRVLTASFDKTARLWEADSGELLVTLEGHSDPVTGAVFSPDDRRVLTASSDGTARLWEADSGKLLAVFENNSNQVKSAVFSPDGRRVLTASSDNTARLWEANSGKLLATLQGHGGPVNSAVFSPDGRRVLTASNDNTARLWDADCGLLATLQGHLGPITSAVFSPDGRRVLTASSDNTARLWEVDGGRLLAIFQGHKDEVWSAVFSPDGRRVLTASDDNTARLWEADGGKLLATFQGHKDEVWRAVFSPDGRRVLTASDDNTARLWEADSGRLLASFQGHSGEVWSAVFSPDGRRVLTASSDNTARLWEVDGGRLLAIFQGHKDGVWSAVFSPDGRRVLTASADATARLWDADSGKFLATFQGHKDEVRSAVFSPDGQRVLTASLDNTARLWGADSGKLLATFQGHKDEVRSAVFSPDGQRVLTASLDNTARLWEADSGRLLAIFRGHGSRVNSAVFSPDGRRILTASFDNTARLWTLLKAKLPPPNWSATFLVWLGGERIAPDGPVGPLSRDERRGFEEQLRQHVNEDSDYARLLRWRLLPPERRAVDPYGQITQEQAADLIIRPDMNEYEAEHAYDLDPQHPLIDLALAGFEKDPIEAEFLRRYSLDRLPNDPKLRQRAAKLLRIQGKEDLARAFETNK